MYIKRESNMGFTRIMKSSAGVQPTSSCRRVLAAGRCFLSGRGGGFIDLAHLSNTYLVRILFSTDFSTVVHFSTFDSWFSVLRSSAAAHLHCSSLKNRRGFTGMNSTRRPSAVKGRRWVRCWSQWYCRPRPSGASRIIKVPLIASYSMPVNVFETCRCCS